MKLQSVLIKMIIIATWFSMPFTIMAQDQLVSLKHGVYVEAGTACKDAPFAAMKSWDGHGFAGPHSSQCTSQIVTRHGNQYKVRTACSALGDGTPNPSGHVDTETIQLTQLSDVSFAVGSQTKARLTYRWCSAK